MARVNQDIEFVGHNNGRNLGDETSARPQPLCPPVERHQPGRQSIPAHVSRRIEYRSCLPIRPRNVDSYQISIERQWLEPAEMDNGLKIRERNGARGIDYRRASSIPSSATLVGALPR